MKGTNQSENFENFELSGQNSPNSCHFWNNKSVFLFLISRASFLLIFASLFCVMTHNGYEIFKLKHYMLWTKRAHQSRIFQTFECSNESSTNSSCNFWNHKVRFYSNFASLFSVMTRNSRILFLAEILCIFNKRSLSKYEFGKSLKFWTLVGFFCPSHIKFPLKKPERVISHYT